MQASTVILVNDSWLQAKALGPQVGLMFYAHLFDADPALRPLFPGNIEPQAGRLLQMVDIAVGMLDRPQALLPLLRRLGERHGGYGVQPAHYATVGAALLKTLDQGLGEGFTPTVRAAWAEVYGVISATMVEAAQAVPATASAA